MLQFMPWISQELKQNHATSLEEREALIQKLRDALNDRDQAVRSSDADDEMQRRIADKDNLIQVSGHCC